MRRMLFLAGAVAAYALRSRSRARRSAPDQSERTGDTSRAGDSRGRIADRSMDTAAHGDGRADAGITGLPPDAEDALQSSLPPRGQRKEGFHA